MSNPGITGQAGFPDRAGVVFIGNGFAPRFVGENRQDIGTGYKIVGRGVSSVFLHTGLVRHWWGLSAVFAYVSLDEFVSLHESMNSWFDFDGVLYFGWVIPASVLVSIFVLSYLKFLAHLPAITRFRFVRAGAIFVGGAMGVELALAYWTDLHGSSNLVYALIDWVEETMEMTGAELFLAANIAVLTNQTGQLRVVSGTADADAPNALSRMAVG